MQNRPELINELNDAWLNLTLKDIKSATYKNPLKITEVDKNNYGMTPARVSINPDYLMYAAKLFLNVELFPIQAAILAEIWNKPFPMLIGSRGLSKSSSMAYYALLKMVLTPRNQSGGPGVKIIIAGAGFRQAKQVFEYMEGVYRNAPVLRSLNEMNSTPVSRENDRYTLRVGSNSTIAIPIGTGEKIRGLRANIVLADEFSSISPFIFETVIQGFASVSSNPIEAMKMRAKQAKAKELGMLVDIPKMQQNQIVISGTAGYDFEHFADYWRKYKTIIESQGNPDKLTEVFPDGVPEQFNWKDYSIIRVPYDKIPKGFLDENILIRAEATITSGTFACEFGAVFSKDSQGFFKRSIIDGCTASEKNVNKHYWPEWCPSVFDATVLGDARKEYIIAIDPASEADNFSIVIIELHQEHSRVVYCWTTNKKQHRALLSAGLIDENDFYAYCAKKIRQLMRAFPCKKIGLDSQGGGVAIREALHNKAYVESGEHLIWPVIDPDKPSDYDYESGLHMLEMINFADYEWLSQANHGLKSDMESRCLLFPRFDAVSLEVASAKDRAKEAKFEEENPGFSIQAYDTIENCVFEIEELKNELTSICLTRTGTGPNSRDRWDTPEVKLPNGKKGRLRKDRYSSLVIANMIARQTRTQRSILQAGNIGGLIVNAKGVKSQYFEFAPDDIRKGLTEFFDSL